jgi:hypothetical protein
VQVRIAGPDPARLRELGARAAAALEATGRAAGVRDDWGILGGPDRPGAPVELTVGTIGDGPDARDLTLRLLAPGKPGPAPAKPSEVSGDPASRGEAGLPRARRDGKPVVTVAAFPAPGLYPSEVLAAARPALDALEASLPAGYRIGYGGEAEEQVKGFRQLAWALVLSVLLIGLALAIQFRSARKPLLVFATIPFGVAGAFVALRLANAPFGFMAFLGIASLIGVIVSHVIVLFDRIEALEREGQALEPALVDAVRSRARPVLVTVAATVIALVPLARRGGPLWEPLCYAQMGGLTLATVVTFVLVPALYAVAVRDLRLIPWGSAGTPLRPRG